MNVPPWGSPDVEALTSETSASVGAETYPPERHETPASSWRRSNTFSGALGLPVTPLVRQHRLAFWLLRTTHIPARSHLAARPLRFGCCLTCMMVATVLLSCTGSAVCC